MTKYVLEDGDGNRVEDSDQFPEGPVYEDRMIAERYKPWAENFVPSPVTIETVEQDDETTDDSNTNMNDDYSFIGNDSDDNDQQTTEDDFSVVGNKWNLGDHSTASGDETNALSDAIGETMDSLDSDVDEEMFSVLQDAQDLVRSTDIHRFECPSEDCGLGHSHADHKHDIRSAFDVEGDFAEQMQFVPYCHCGVNELAMLVQFFPYISVPVFADQHQFEGVLEVDPDILDSMYRRFNEDDTTVHRVAGMVATEYGVTESEAIPLGVREDIKLFFERRRSIEKAAQAAPIAQETRNAIEEARDQLEERTSQ